MEVGTTFFELGCTFDPWDPQCFARITFQPQTIILQGSLPFCRDLTQKIIYVVFLKMRVLDLHTFVETYLEVIYRRVC